MSCHVVFQFWSDIVFNTRELYVKYGSTMGGVKKFLHEAYACFVGVCIFFFFSLFVLHFTI